MNDMIARLAKLTFRYYNLTLTIRGRGQYIAADLRKLQDETRSLCKEIQQLSSKDLEEHTDIESDVKLIANE